MFLYKKTIIHHKSLYIVALTKKPDLPYILFLHGGPGLNCGVLEYLIEHEGLFDSLNFNVILYDQQGCGRSQQIDEVVSHADNICDLEEVYKTLTDTAGFNIAAIAGHSYGAKLLFDYLHSYQKKIPSIFIAIASSMLTPRINNLLLDFSYLKSIDEKEYQKALEEFDSYSSEMLWQLTERLASVFQENKMRPYFYWANLIWKEKVINVQNIVSLPINAEVFKSVRQDLYTQPDNFSVDIEMTLKSPYLWINGFHDFVMDGASALIKKNTSVTLFLKSAHYPHIEEHNKFCGEVNEFLKKN